MKQLIRISAALLLLALSVIDFVQIWACLAIAGVVVAASVVAIVAVIRTRRSNPRMLTWAEVALFGSAGLVSARTLVEIAGALR